VLVLCVKEILLPSTHAFRKNNHRFHHQPTHLISHYISNNDKEAGIITTEEADNDTAWRHASSWIHGS